MEDDATYGDFSSALAEMIGILQPLAPPPEVADWHDKGLELLQALKTLVDAQPEDSVVGFEFMAIASAIEGLEEELSALERELPDEIRQPMLEAGCIEGPLGDQPDDDVRLGLT